MTRKRAISLIELIDKIAGIHGFTFADIYSKRKTGQLTAARADIGTAAHNAGYSYPQIGRATNKHHTTYVKLANMAKLAELAKRKAAK